MGVIDTGTLTREFFEERLGGIFSLETSPAVELKLERVASAGTPAPGAMRDPFRVEFSGPPGLRMPQQIYRMHHAGELLELFLVQTGDGIQGSQVEAIFS
jgi:hypothetical protein